MMDVERLNINHLSLIDVFYYVEFVQYDENASHTYALLMYDMIDPRSLQFHQGKYSINYLSNLEQNIIPSKIQTNLLMLLLYMLLNGLQGTNPAVHVLGLYIAVKKIQVNEI